LPAAAVGVRRWGLGRVQRRLLVWTGRRPARPGAPPAEDVARRTAWVVEAVARRVPWSANCLQRSLVLWFVLRLRGLPAELRIGVRRSSDVEQTVPLAFHAWVEEAGEVLNEARDIRSRFATFDRAILPPGAVWR
jgi:hypothetical protein